MVSTDNFITDKGHHVYFLSVIITVLITCVSITASFLARDIILKILEKTPSYRNFDVDDRIWLVVLLIIIIIIASIILGAIYLLLLRFKSK